LTLAVSFYIFFTCRFGTMYQIGTIWYCTNWYNTIVDCHEEKKKKTMITSIR